MLAAVLAFFRGRSLSLTLHCAVIVAGLGCGSDQPNAPVKDAMGNSMMGTTSMDPLAGRLGPPTTPAGGSGGQRSAPPQAVDGGRGAPPVAPVAGGAGGGGTGGMPAAAAAGCTPRAVEGEPALHFHHVHFNTTDPAADIEFFMKFYNAKADDFCMDSVSGEPTVAAKTERGYFLFNKVEMAPDPALNTHIDHVGFAHPMPTMELQRLMALDVPLWEPGDQLQCMDVVDGTACFGGVYFYTQAPSGARIEVSNSPGPSMMGFGHTHLSGEFPAFWMQVLGASLQNAGGTMHVDGVNITNTLLEMRAPESPVETKGKPLDHLAYSTADIEGTLEQIMGAGITIEEEVSFKPAFGFKSFMIKSPEGIWVEIVEDSPFQP
jgi:hypothetical protein